MSLKPLKKSKQKRKDKNNNFAELNHDTPVLNPAVTITPRDRAAAETRNAEVMRELEAFRQANPETGTIEGIIACAGSRKSG